MGSINNNRVRLLELGQHLNQAGTDGHQDASHYGRKNDGRDNDACDSFSSREIVSDFYQPDG